MNVGIIGMGFVGGTTAKVFADYHNIFPYDKYIKKYQNKNVLKKAEVIFVCVPTPMKTSGEIDLTAIYDSLDVIKSLKINPIVVIRSTTVSGTTRKLKEKYNFSLVYNPEFLRERHAIRDMMNTNRIIIGAENYPTALRVAKVYEPIFPKEEVKIIYCTLEEAEMMKYASNTILAAQIAIANEIYQICKVKGICYNHIKDMMLLDSRIGRNIDVPGFDGKFGFGGKCFPKDLNALIYLARENGYSPYLLEEVWRLNKRVRND